MKALVIGGTGPTGPDVVSELLRRGYEVSVLHRGLHEPADAVLRRVEHIHADPHYPEPLAAALAGRRFEVIVAAYGRMRLNVEVATGRCDRFVGIGGNPVHPGMLERSGTWPTGMRILAGESDPTVGTATAAASLPTASRRPRPDPSRTRFAIKVAEAERSVLQAHGRGEFSATYIRYPIIYGRRTWLAFERGVIRRLLDGRRRLLLPDGGLSVYSRCADRNAAALVGLVLDHPEVSAGEVYHAADEEQFSLYQWTEMLCGAVGADAEIVGIPLALARPIWDLLPTGPTASPHTLVDTTKARTRLGYRDLCRPAVALAELVDWLLADASRTDVAYDARAEDAVLEEVDALGDRLATRLGWDPADPFRRSRTWHPYDHPPTGVTDTDRRHPG